jgi:predicted DNA-binding transcriptional regulator AlpA
MTDAAPIRWCTSLADLETAVGDVSANDAFELAARLQVLVLRLAVRLQAPATAPAGEQADDDRLLDAGQAAALLGVKKSWIFDHSAELSPVPLPGRLLRFSESKLRRWMRRTSG